MCIGFRIIQSNIKLFKYLNSLKYSIQSSTQLTQVFSSLKDLLNSYKYSINFRLYFFFGPKPSYIPCNIIK